MQINSNLALLRQLISHGLLNHYCYYLKLKHKYSNSLYYNFNINKIARVGGISHSCVKRKVNTLMQRGWCFTEHGHLKFRSISEICAIEKLTVKLFISISIDLTKPLKETKLALQRIILDDNIRKQEFIISIKQDLHNPTELKAHKAAKRKASKLSSIPGEIAQPPMISVHGLANLFHCSPTTAQRIKTDFRRLRYFDFYKQIHCIASAVTKAAYKKAFQPYFSKAVFYFKGCVYQSMPSLVVRVHEG
jgi:hypothetical protein